MRVSTAFNRLLQIPGATVTEVVIGERDVEVTLRPRARLVNCPCGKRLQSYFEAVIAAVELGLSNALIEGINAKIWLVNARGYGHHSAQTLTSMIYLTLGGLHPQLPTKT